MDRCSCANRRRVAGTNFNHPLRLQLVTRHSAGSSRDRDQSRWPSTDALRADARGHETTQHDVIVAVQDSDRITYPQVILTHGCRPGKRPAPPDPAQPRPPAGAAESAGNQGCMRVPETGTAAIPRAARGYLLPSNSTISQAISCLRRGSLRMSSSMRLSSSFSAMSATIAASTIATWSSCDGPRPVASHSKLTFVLTAISDRCSVLGVVPSRLSHCATALRRTPTAPASSVCVMRAPIRARRMRVAIACIDHPFSLRASVGDAASPHKAMPVMFYASGGANRHCRPPPALRRARAASCGHSTKGARMPHWATLIRDIPDFPGPGVVFKDIMPMLADADAFAAAIEAMAAPWRDARIDAVLAIEARGFLLGAPLA